MINGEKMREIMQNLTDEEKDYIYRQVWQDHVKEDILSYVNDSEMKITEKEAETCAYIFVQCGKYDCNLSYWDNIDNVIKKGKKTVEVLSGEE